MSASVMLDHTAFPHLLDRILELADDKTLLALRPTCRHIKEYADEHLWAHIVVRTLPSSQSGAGAGAAPSPIPSPSPSLNLIAGTEPTPSTTPTPPTSTPTPTLCAPGIEISTPRSGVLARLAASDVYTGLNGAPAPFDTLAFVFRHMQVLDVMDGIDDAVLYRLVQATVHPGTVRRLRVRLFGSAVGAPIHAHPGIELALSIIDDMQPSSRGPLPRALQAVSCARLAQSCRLAYPLCKNANVVYAPLDVPLELGDRLQKQVRNRMGYTDDFGVTIVVTGTPELQPELEPEGEEQLDIQTAFLNNIMGVAFDPEAARRVSAWKNNKQISVMSLREYVADHLEDVMFDTGLDGQFTTAEELLAFLT